MSDSTDDTGASSGTDDALRARDAAAPEATAKPRGRRRVKGERRPTRIGAAWTAVIVGVILGVALVDFIVENTRSVRVEFFSASGRMPVAVALLAAALCGAAVVLIVGVCRTLQLRRIMARREREAATETETR